MFEGFQKFVPKITNQLNLNTQLASATICSYCRQIIQNDYPELAPHLNVISFKQGTLKIQGANNLILNELNYIKLALISKINSQIEKNALLQHLRVSNIITTN